MKDNATKTKKRGRTLKKVFKWVTLTLLGGAVVLGVVMAAMPKPVAVERATASRGELVVKVSEDGKTRVKDRYVVSAPLSGNLARMELHSGDEVKQGDVLARIVPLKAPLLDARARTQTEAQVAAARAATKQVQAQIERAKAALDFAKTEAGRVRALHEAKAVSQSELDRALLEERAREAELTSAQFGKSVAAHELRMARAALGQYDSGDETDSFTVPSPVTGRILKIIHESEGVVQAGAPLLEVGDPKALEVVVDVLTSDAVSIQPNSPATIHEWGGEPLEAVVRSVEPSAFTRVSALGIEEQRVNAIVDLRSPYEAWQRLGDGYRVDTRIEVFRVDGVLKVPLSALFRHEGQWATFVVEQGRAALRPLEIGRRNDSHAEILSGLEEGTQVVVHPSDNVTDGVEVESL